MSPFTHEPRKRRTAYRGDAPRPLLHREWKMVKKLPLDRFECVTCGDIIASHHGRSRAKKRGHGFCTQRCEAIAKSVNADGKVAMRLMNRVDRAGGDDGCWPYRGRTSPFGYGLIDWGGNPHAAHQVMFMLIHGPIPKGHVICHACDNPICCNPGHLWSGTQGDNNRDMWSKGRARPRPSKGTSHGCAKLTDDAVRAIRASTLSRKDLAAQYGVTTTQVSNIISRRQWRHV